MLLFSGGVDSFVAYHVLNKPATIYYDLGTKYSDKELHAIDNNFKFNTTIDKHSLKHLGKYEQSESAFIPFRNLYLCMQVLADYQSVDTIYIAGLKDDNVNDKNEAIFKRWSVMFSEMLERDIRIDSPFWEMTKSDVISLYVNEYGNVEDIINLVSCYNGSHVCCNKCKACFRKNCAIYTATDYFIPFYNEALVDKYLIATYYDRDRIKAIRTYAKKVKEGFINEIEPGMRLKAD